MDKLNYTNDTTAVTPGAKLTEAPEKALAATGNITHGYFAGGEGSIVQKSL